MLLVRSEFVLNPLISTTVNVAICLSVFACYVLLLANTLISLFCAMCMGPAFTILILGIVLHCILLYNEYDS
jgi:hypothetical protein